MIPKKGGFTLVELIVVISILAVLATIGYISFSGYISTARDTTRIHNISVIERAIEYHREKEPQLFQPENMIPITLSGTVVGYQGDIGKTNLGKIGITQGGTDPLDGEYYSYFLSGNKAQILALLENSKETILTSNISSTFAVTDYTDRFPYFKGSPLGMILTEDNTPIHRDIDVIAEGEFDIFNPNFSIKYIKSLYSNDTLVSLPALMIGGQLSLNSKVRTTDECPINFIPIPGNKELGQPDFCIGKYEASTPGNDDTLTYETIPNVLPLTQISNTNLNFAIDCRGNGPNYHIMTIMEWLTIARNIENNPMNWSTGITGSGYIIGGNNGNNNTGFDLNLTSPLVTGSTGNPSQDTKRQLIISNGEIIWDFIGNVWEVVKPLNLYGIEITKDNEIIETLKPSTPYRTALELFGIEGITNNSTYYSWSALPEQDYTKLYGPKIGMNDESGIGKIREVGKYTTLVGGDYSDGLGYENGLYSIIRSISNNATNIGTRCAYSY